MNKDIEERFDEFMRDCLGTLYLDGKKVEHDGEYQMLPEIKSFLYSELKLMGEKIKLEKLKPEGNIGWFFKFNNGLVISKEGAIGYNQAIDQIKNNIDTYLGEK
jgi:hypothetical protein